MSAFLLLVEGLALLVEGLALLGNVSFQRSLRATCFHPLLCFTHFYLKEWKVAGWPEFDLQWLRELGFYLLEDVLYLAGIIN